MKIISHRGGAGHWPENSTKGLINSIELGVFAVECDVHLSLSGDVIVIHDPVLSRLTDDIGLVCERDTEELLKLKTVGGGDISKLDTWADIISGSGVRLSLEIKTQLNGDRYQDIEEKCVEILKKHSCLENCIIHSFSQGVVSRIYEIDKTIRVAINIEHETRADEIIKIAKSVHADDINIKHSLISKDMVDKFHENNFTCTAWTVNDINDMVRVRDLGVDHITTDHPMVAKQIEG